MPPLWPGVNSGFNACATLCIIAGLIAVKRGRVEGHKKFMLAAFALSVCFLASYVAYHAMGNETPYPEDAPGRGGYLILLASHVLLAMPTAILVPIVVWLGVRDRLDRHRKWAKITAPLWLYVSFTGVLVYWWLYWYAGARPIADAAAAAGA
jgi:putative membrane protein